MEVLLVNPGDTVTITLGEKSNGVFIEAAKVEK